MSYSGSEQLREVCKTVIKCKKRIKKDDFFRAKMIPPNKTSSCENMTTKTQRNKCKFKSDNSLKNHQSVKHSSSQACSPIPDKWWAHSYWQRPRQSQERPSAASCLPYIHPCERSRAIQLQDLPMPKAWQRRQQHTLSILSVRALYIAYWRTSFLSSSGSLSIRALYSSTISFTGTASPTYQ